MGDDVQHPLWGVSPGDTKGAVLHSLVEPPHSVPYELQAGNGMEEYACRSQHGDVSMENSTMD